jgi:hypothetical protein
MEYIIANIDNVNQLLREFNNITILSDNKKLLLLSYLNEIIILSLITFNINILINLILKRYIIYFIIYPLNFNIIHY